MDYCHAFGCFPELEGKILSYKTPYTSDTGIGGINVELTENHAP